MAGTSHPNFTHAQHATCNAGGLIKFEVERTHNASSDPGFAHHRSDHRRHSHLFEDNTR